MKLNITYLAFPLSTLLLAGCTSEEAGTTTVTDTPEQSAVETTAPPEPQTEDRFTGYDLIEVEGGELSGERESNVVVDIGYGDREYWGVHERARSTRESDCGRDCAAR